MYNAAKITDKQYVESHVWQCQKSTTGAHYWVDGPASKSIFICKWCGVHKDFHPEK